MNENNFCTRCGAPLPPNAQNCVHCGYPVFKPHYTPYIVVIVISCILNIILFALCTGNHKVAMSTDDEKSSKEITNIAQYEGCALELMDAEFVDNRLIVHVAFANTNKEPVYAESGFAVKAYQNDIEIDRVYNYTDSEKERNLTKEVKNNKGLKCDYVFALTDKSEVEVCVYSPTADQILLAKKIYKNN